MERPTNVQSKRGDEDRCAICEQGQGVHMTRHGRLICSRCLASSKAVDAVELRREQRRKR